MPEREPTTFDIEEDIPSGALSVRLEKSDLPIALPRATPAFQSGGEVKHETVRLPGRKRPIFQVQQPTERDFTIRGAFRDHLFVRDGGPEGVFHARAMRDALEQIRNRCNPVRITWGTEQRLGLLVESTFDEESEHEIAYELQFEIGVGVLDRGIFLEDSQRREIPAQDVAAQLRELVAARQAQLEAFAALGAAVSVVSTISGSLAALDTALANLGDGGTALAAVAHDTLAAASRVYGLGRSVQIAARNTIDAVENISPDEAVPGHDADALAAWFALHLATVDDCETIIAEARDVRARALAETRSTVRLYTIAPTDTLESIARAQLGDATRAGELGLRSDQLRAGRVIRIPEAR